MSTRLPPVDDKHDIDLSPPGQAAREPRIELIQSHKPSLRSQKERLQTRPSSHQLHA